MNVGIFCGHSHHMMTKEMLEMMRVTLLQFDLNTSLTTEGSTPGGSTTNMSSKAVISVS